MVCRHRFACVYALIISEKVNRAILAMLGAAVIGASANLVVAKSAFLLMLLSIFISHVYIYLRYLSGQRPI